MIFSEAMMKINDVYEFRRFHISRHTDQNKSYKNPSKSQCELTERKRKIMAEREEREINREYDWS